MHAAEVGDLRGGPASEAVVAGYRFEDPRVDREGLQLARTEELARQKLEALAREVIGQLQARHPEAARTALHAAPDLPTLPLDPARMRLLLRNLLDNALRHSAGAPLPPELHLSTEGQGIRIEVRDHGPGVPDEQIPHLAEPFFRPDTARTRAQGGVGLGLYLCKLVAQAHGGTFEVRNARPGLAVRVVLPPR